MSGSVSSAHLPVKPELVKHVFHAVDSHAKVWSTLTLFSFARSSDKLPVFVEGNPISGTLEVDTKKAEGVPKITIYVSCLYTRLAPRAALTECLHFPPDSGPALPSV
jgi:hypothetical protein